MLRIVGRGVKASDELDFAPGVAPPLWTGIDRRAESCPALSHAPQQFDTVSASLEEGFDYPVLEAKAEGIPTLLSQIPVHAEFHAGSSLFFPTEGGEEAFADALSQLLIDSRLWWDLSAAGRQLALSLSVARQQHSLCAQIADLS